MDIKKTCGWTILDWQVAYQNLDIKIEDLIRFVEQLDPNDPAWISIASRQHIQDQIEQLQNAILDASSSSDEFPLYGIPFAVKDNIDVADFVSTAACQALTTKASKDATLIQRLKQAGAIVVGKTNLDQFATGLVGTRSPYGAVHNTFDADYVSGGSSSGSASVVARGLVPFSLGTDTAGSGRIPAGFNNIVGLKPTKGRFSNNGLLPACKSLDCISIFALTVKDAEYVANLAEGYDEQDSYSRHHPNTAPAQFSKQPVFAIPSHLEFFGDHQAKQAFKTAVAKLKSLDVSIKEIDFTPFKTLALQLYQSAWVAERTAALTPYLTEHHAYFDPTVRQIVQQGHQYSAVDAYQAEYLKQDLARQIQSILAEVDALFLPTSPTIYTIEQIKKDPIQYNSHFGTYTNFTNLADLSALALPAGFREDGLPHGITLIANAWHDQALVHFGKYWQNHLNLTLGATHQPLKKQPTISPPSKHHVRIAVVGAHLTGMPLNAQLTERQAVLIETTQTSPTYSLYALKGTTPPKPGLARDEINGQQIIVELWDIPLARFGEFVVEIPTPLGIGNIELTDGRWVKGFICEPYGLQHAEDISHFGGWRAYIQHLHASHTA